MKGRSKIPIFPHFPFLPVQVALHLPTPENVNSLDAPHLHRPREGIESPKPLNPILTEAES